MNGFHPLDCSTSRLSVIDLIVTANLSESTFVVSMRKLLPILNTRKNERNGVHRSAYVSASVISQCTGNCRYRFVQRLRVN